MSRLSTWLSTSKKTPVDESTGLLEDLAKLRLRVRRLEITEEELVARQDSLVKQIQTLRGMITGGIRRGAEQPAGVDSIPTGDKAKLREYAGLTIVRKTPPGES